MNGSEHDLRKCMRELNVHVNSPKQGVEAEKRGGDF